MSTECLKSSWRINGHCCCSSFVAVLLMVLAIAARAPVSFAESGSTDNTATRSKVHSGETLPAKATYYPDKLNGHETSSGDTFHQSAHTAASNRLPLGTHVKVTNIENGKSTDVKINDRGAALGKQKIDLSKKAAKEIGLTHQEGKVPVAITVTRPPAGSIAVQPSP
jgi:rare lipoprotein A